LPCLRTRDKGSSRKLARNQRQQLLEDSHAGGSPQSKFGDRSRHRPLLRRPAASDPLAWTITTSPLTFVDSPRRFARIGRNVGSSAPLKDFSIANKPRRGPWTVSPFRLLRAILSGFSAQTAPEKPQP